MKDKLIRALVSHAQGEINYHKANIDVYLNNPVGIGEHPDIMGAITEELDKIARYQDQIDVIEKHLK